MSTASVYWDLQKAAIRGSMQYRLDFVVSSLLAMAYQGSGFAFLWVVLKQFPSIGGWSFPEVAFLYGVRLLSHAVWRLPCNQLSSLEYVIREGMFDRYLLRPINPLLQLMTRRFFLGNAGDVIVAVGVFGYATTIADVSWTPLHILYLLLAIVGGALAEGAFVLVAISLGFKSLETWAGEYLVDQTYLLFGSYPLSLFGSATGWLMTWLIPVAFIAYIPSAVMLDATGRLSVAPIVAYAGPLIGAAWFYAAYRWWLHKVSDYQSAGS